MLPKYCPICKKIIIANWESACQRCWQRTIEQDLCPLCRGNGTWTEPNTNGRFTLIRFCPKCGGSGYIGNKRIYLIMFNHIRETLRECGLDIYDMPEWMYKPNSEDERVIIG